MLEIGYGGGEHLARQAEEHPDTGFVGAEVFSGGIGKMLEKIEEAGLSNIRLYHRRCAQAFAEAAGRAHSPASYLLYPDPWPKTRHHKRRFISPLTLGELARTLRPGGFFRFATDIETYADWGLAHILRLPDFSWDHGAPGSWHEPYPGWQPTRYEEKARLEGRLKSWYFTFVRA